MRRDVEREAETETEPERAVAKPEIPWEVWFPVKGRGAGCARVCEGQVWRPKTYDGRDMKITSVFKEKNAAGSVIDIKVAYRRIGWDPLVDRGAGENAMKVKTLVDRHRLVEKAEG